MFLTCLYESYPKATFSLCAMRVWRTMERIEIDQDICTRCGLCGQVCPHGLITVNEDVVTADYDGCMDCGHCRAVCPVGAVSGGTTPVELHLKAVREETDALAPGDYDCAGLVQLMRSRRSCRRYSERGVPLEMLEDLVKIGTTAPSGTNSQSWEFVILPERKDVEVLGALTAEYYRRLNCMAANPLYRFLTKFSGDALGKYYREYYDSVAKALREWEEEGRDRLFHGAVAAVLVTGKVDASCPAEDALLASQNILLAAHALGLGTCLIGFAVEAMRRSRKICRELAIPTDEKVYSVIGLGYPAVTYQKVAGRRVVAPRVLHLAG